MRRLFLFTARFPYLGSENFLEDEILFLSNAFDEVHIVPFKRTESNHRKTPDNCIIHEVIVTDKKHFIKNLFFNKKIDKLLFKELLSYHVLFNLKRIKVWLTAYVVCNNILNSKIIQDIGKDITSNDICYFYWGKWSNVLSIFWKDKAQMISRFHGQWDLWEEEYDNYVPLRNKISESLDFAVFISKKGERYFHNRYPNCATKIFRLGTQDVGIIKRSVDGKLRVLSCSTVYPLKRVNLILKSVVKVSKKKDVEWTHIGGGDDYDIIKSEAEKEQNEHLQIEMPGQMKYEEVLEYYKSHPFDIFINLSTNEGIPVSIMEAISCDVPVVATNVGGTSEIVNKYTGELVSENPSPQEVADTILKVINNRIDYSPRFFWQQYYMANSNYYNYAKFIAHCNKRL